MSLRDAVIEIATSCGECGLPWTDHAAAGPVTSTGCTLLACWACDGTGHRGECADCHGAGGPGEGNAFSRLSARGLIDRDVQ